MAFGVYPEISLAEARVEWHGAAVFSRGLDMHNRIPANGGRMRYVHGHTDPLVVADFQLTK